MYWYVDDESCTTLILEGEPAPTYEACRHAMHNINQY